MLWIDLRKKVTKFIEEKNYFKKSVEENQEILQDYQTLVNYLGQDSQIDIVQKTVKEIGLLESILKEQENKPERIELPKKEHFSLSSYLNLLPFPRNPTNAKLRNVLLMNYDDNYQDAMKRFVSELQTLNSLSDYRAIEELQGILTGVEIALQRGFLGRELQRNNQIELGTQVMNLISEYSISPIQGAYSNN